MTRFYREFTYTAPLSTPVELDAYIAPDDDAPWRLIVFPGTPCSKLLYTRFLRTAPYGVEVIVITRPGFAKGQDEAVLPFEEQIAAIKPFLPSSAPGGGEYGDKKIITMGISYGGELALKAAVDFHEHVHGAVTVAALIEEPHDYALKLEEFGRDQRLGPYVPNRWKKVRAEVAGRRDQIGPVLDAAGKLDIPIEVIHGDFDAMVPKSNADALMSKLGPNANCEIIPGGTHYLELQYPRRLHAAVGRVIERANVESWLQGDQTTGKTPDITSTAET